MPQLKVVKGNVTLGKVQGFTDDEWVDVLRSAEAKTVESVLKMCFAWNELLKVCQDSEEEQRFKDICADCGVSDNVAYKRAQIGSHTNLFLAHASKMPTAIEPLVGLCRIDNEQLEQLLEEDGYIHPQLSREDAKALKDDAVTAKSSAKYQGNIIEYLKEKDTLPAPTGDEGGEEVDEKAEKKSKREQAKAKKVAEEQAAKVKAEAKAGKKKLKDIDYLAESLIDLVCVPDLFDSVVKSMKQYYHPDKPTGSQNDFNTVIAIEEVLGEHMVQYPDDED